MDDHQHHLADGVDDRHGPHVQIPAVAPELYVAGDGHQTVGDVHDEVGKAQHHDLPHGGGAWPEIAPAQPQQRLPAQQKRHHQRRRRGLGENGRQGRAPDAHVHQIDEDRVEHNVQHRPGQHRAHTDTGEALGVDEEIHPEAEHDEERTGGVDPAVGLGVGVGGVAGAEEIQQRTQTGLAHGGQHQAGDQQQRQRAAHDLLRLPVVAFPAGDGAERPAAGAEEHREGRDERENGGADPDAGQGQTALEGDVADVHAVHHTVENVDELGQHHGDGHVQNRAPDAALGKIVSVFAVLCLHTSPIPSAACKQAAAISCFKV